MSVYQSVSSDSAAMTFFLILQRFQLTLMYNLRKSYVNSPSQKGPLTADLPGIELKERHFWHEALFSKDWRDLNMQWNIQLESHFWIGPVPI